MQTGDHSETAAHFVADLRSVLGEPSGGIALHEPVFAGHEWDYVKECIDTGWVSSVGKFVDEFERRLAEYTGARHAVAAVNGTAALHAALVLAGVERGDEVIIPALTFVATANAVSHCGAVPHFADSSPSTFGIDPAALAEYLDSIAERAGGGWRNRLTGRKLGALVPMHVFGHPVDMPELMEVANRYGLVVVEDAAESLGSRIGTRHTGTFGLLGVFSFNGNKILSTGGGGAIVTNDPGLAHRLKHLTTTAKLPHRWEFVHDEVAFNYRMPNINAALGCAQLEQLNGFVEQKRRLAGAYSSQLLAGRGYTYVREPDGCTSNYWLNAVRLDHADRTLRDALLDAANTAGYGCRPVWTLMHRLPMYQSCPRAPLPVAERLESQLINIPSGAALAQRLR